MADGEQFGASLRPDVLPTAPYSSRPPSPPYIHVPAPQTNATTPTTPGEFAVMTIHPSPTAIHALSLTPADLSLITRDAPQHARDPTFASATTTTTTTSSSTCSSSSSSSSSSTPTPPPLLPPPAAAGWVYESRRAAQPVLDYLYLGPASVARDRAFLLREGITMVLLARDARFPILGAALVRAVEGFGLEVATVDVADGRELVAAFTTCAERVNAHLLRVRRQGGGGEGGAGPGRQGGGGWKAGGGCGGGKGKVLVCCETGNERSAAVVAAYLMAMYGLDTVQAAQFLLLQRFCVTMGEDVKHGLKAYEDILRARRAVGSTMTAGVMESRVLQGFVGGNLGGAGVTAHAKRRIEETRGQGGESDGDEVMEDMDDERYEGREFAPFVERSV